MTALDGCAQRAASTLNDEKCRAAIAQFHHVSKMVFNYWNTSTELSGGLTSTKNREEQTNRAEALWILEGTIQGLKTLYPDRFDNDGALVPSCQTYGDGAGTLYGADACAPVIADYLTEFTAPCLTDACQDNIFCYAGNDPAGAS